MQPTIANVNAADKQSVNARRQPTDLVHESVCMLLLSSSTTNSRHLVLLSMQNTGLEWFFLTDDVGKSKPATLASSIPSNIVYSEQLGYMRLSRVL